MSSVTVVVFVIWALPVVGITIAYFVLSRRMASEVSDFGADRAVGDRAMALEIIRSTQPVGRTRVEVADNGTAAAVRPRPQWVESSAVERSQTHRSKRAIDQIN